MTLTTLITLNAVLGAAVVFGIVHLLAHGIHSDRRERPQSSRRFRHTSPSGIAA